MPVYGPEVEVQLMHNLDSTYGPRFRSHRFRRQDVVLARPPSRLYSAPIMLTCHTCGETVTYQILSVAAAWLLGVLWLLLAIAGLATLVIGAALGIRSGGADGIWSTLLVTKFGVGGTGTRWTFHPHGVRPQRNSGAPDRV